MSFPTDDVGTISDEARGVMLDLILAWARLDTACSIWVTLAFGMCTDSGPILLGNMDTKGKLDKLKALCIHHGMKDAAVSVATLNKVIAHHVPIRNAITHATLVGQRLSAPYAVVFAPFKPAPSVLEYMTINECTVGDIRKAAQFAIDAGNRLMAAQEPAVARPSRRPSELLEFPRFRLPSPEKKPKNKRPPRPRSPRG